MRGLIIETAQDFENIKKLAAETAASLGVKPGIHFPDADHSYSGPIVNVNAHFAAQLVDKDEKTGVGFIAIHNISDLGQSVYKGQDMRFDYDEKRQVGVRTVEVFKEQQKERAELSELATQKIDKANVRNASTKEGQKYNGNVLGVTKHFVLQHVGRDTFQIHNLENLASKEISQGQRLEITYKNDRGNVVDLDKKKEAALSQGQGR
jgi:hypothetical protein